MSNRVYILGGHQTDFARAWSREGLDISSMIQEVAQSAIEKTHLDYQDIQSIHVGNAFSELQRQQGHLSAIVAQVIPELANIPAMRHESACASGSLAVLSAMSEIEAKRYDCILVLGAEEFKNVPGNVASSNQNAASWQGREEIECQFMWPAVFGKISEEYNKRYGLDRQYLNRIAEINYENAKLNPLSQTRNWQFNEFSFTDNDEFNPLIEPGTRRQDCGQVTDGACAIILASDEFAKKYAQKHNLNFDTFPYIEGWGHRTTGIRFLDKLTNSQNDPYIFPHVRQTILDAWQRAGIKDIQQIDLIETHDCFTSTEYMAIDHFGITPPGQSWQAIESGMIERKGSLPINPSGGLIGTGHPVGATGVRMLLDCYKQLTHQAGNYQIDRPKRAATLNIGGSCATVASFVVAL